jgi:hypothetical protein
MLRLVALVRTNVSQERIAFIISVARICELVTMLVVTSNRSMLPILVSLMTKDCVPPKYRSYKSHAAYHPRRGHSTAGMYLTN